MLNIINSYRFDLMAKYLYIKYLKYSNNLNFYTDLYKEHINVFNKSFESNPDKKNINDFISSFNTLINSIKKNGFDKKNSIELGKNNVIINGAHRLITSFYFNIKPEFKLFDKEGCSIYNYDFFINRNNYWRRDNEIYQNLSIKYADRMALEYIKLKKNIRSLIIYPKGMKKLNKKINKKMNNLINEYGVLYYKKKIKLNRRGIINLIKEMYRGEEWIGGIFPSDYCGGKLDLCYDTNNLIELILIEFKEKANIIEFKKRCRDLFKLDKHSLHIPDNQEQTFRISSTLLNEKSIHFLKYATNNLSEKSKKLFIKYFDKFNCKNSEDICITSSIILEMYGLREAKDIDYIEKDNKNIKLYMFGCHKGKWFNYYKINKENMLYNPENHFYFNGLKFVSLNVIKKMKTNRNEKKDIKDLELINKIKNV